jgi:hypothetical protein
MTTVRDSRMCTCTECMRPMRADTREAVHMHNPRQLLIVITVRGDGAP